MIFSEQITKTRYMLKLRWAWKPYFFISLKKNGDTVILEEGKISTVNPKYYSIIH